MLTYLKEGEEKESNLSAEEEIFCLKHSENNGWEK